jgi:brefeldin A-resistance guanine nucleotide exchange factor 1
MNSASVPDQRAFLLERSVVSLLRMASRLLRREELTGQILSSLRVLLVLLVPASPDQYPYRLGSSRCLLKLHRQVAFGLHDLLKTNAANIHSGPDWTVLFSLLECFGAGARPLPALLPPAVSATVAGLRNNGTH